MYVSKIELRGGGGGGWAVPCVKIPLQFKEISSYGPVERLHAMICWISITVNNFIKHILTFKPYRSKFSLYLTARLWFRNRRVLFIRSINISNRINVTPQFILYLVPYSYLLLGWWCLDYSSTHWTHYSRCTILYSTTLVIVSVW